MRRGVALPSSAVRAAAELTDAAMAVGRSGENSTTVTDTEASPEITLYREPCGMVSVAGRWRSRNCTPRNTELLRDSV